MATSPFVTQNDAISFEVSLFDGDKEIDLSNVTTSTLASTRGDKTTVVVEGEKTGVNKVTFDIGTAETKLTGEVNAVVQLYGEDGRVSTVRFIYKVTSDPTGAGFIPSEREKTLIEVVLGDGPLLIEKAAEAATYFEEKKPLIDKFTGEQTNLQAQVDALVIDGDSSPEAAQARVDAKGTSHTTLKARLDKEMNEVSSSLAEKANRSEVTSMLGNLADATPKFAGSISEMTDVTKLYVNALDGMLYIHDGGGWANTGVKYQSTGLNERSVTPRATTFLNTSTNLFNPETVDIGYTLDNSGNLIANASFAVSDFIDGKSAFPYSVGSVVKVVTYNEAKTHLGAATLAPPNMTTREGTRYFKVIFYPKDVNKVQVNEGSTLLPYERRYVELSSDISLNIRNVDVGQRSITQDKTTFIEMSPNLNTGNGHINKTIVNSTGELADSVGHKTSDFMYLDPGKTKLTDNFIVKRAFYDYKYKFLSMASNPGSWPHTTTIPEGSRYERHVYNNTNAIPEKMLNYGDTLLPYENYYARVFGKKLVPENFTEDSKFVIDGVLDGAYTAPIIPADSSVASLTSAELHTLFDNLVTRFPQYITKTEAFSNSLGVKSYRYDFKAQSVPTVSAGQKTPKMILVSGVHNEKMGAYSLYQSMKQICELWKNNALLETLRWNIHFIVIPVVNAHAFNGGSRKNPNGVDIARNFSTGWVTSSPTSESYGGTAPLSELESIYVDRLLKENRDAVYFTSFHNFFTNADVNNFIWNAGATQLQVNLAKQLISKMSRKWKKEYSWLPQNESTYFGFADRNAPPGSEGLHATSYGIQGSTFEVCESFMLEAGSTKFSSLALTLGSETFINWLLVNLKHNS